MINLAYYARYTNFMSAKRVGIFGGTFDPVHLSHVAIAKAALDQLKLDEVWFFVDKIPKNKPGATDYNHRLAMVDLATKQNSRLMIDPTDQMATHKSYDYTTLVRAKASFPNTKFILIAGIDVMSTFHTWKQRDLLMKEASFAVAPRVGWNNESLLTMLERLGESSKLFDYRFIDVTPSRVSSSKSRHDSDLQDIDKVVQTYIKKHNLYT